MGLLSPAIAQASEAKVTGELRAAGSGYFSAVDGYFLVQFKDQELPWGSRVFLRFGFEQSQFVRGSLVPVSSWNAEREIELASSAPFVWSGAVLEQVYARGLCNSYPLLSLFLELFTPMVVSALKRVIQVRLAFLEESLALLWVRRYWS